MGQHILIGELSLEDARKNFLQGLYSKREKQGAQVASAKQSRPRNNPPKTQLHSLQALKHCALSRRLSAVNRKPCYNDHYDSLPSTSALPSFPLLDFFSSSHPTMATTHAPETNFGTVTSWLPLTTAFPYQSGCSSALWARVGYTSSQFGDAVAFDPGYGITVDPELICMPSQATLWWETETAPTVDEVATLYSIGPVVCPEAHTTAGTSVVNADSTFVACCPS